MDARIQAGSPRPLVLPHLDNFVTDPNTRSGSAAYQNYGTHKRERTNLVSFLRGEVQRQPPSGERLDEDGLEACESRPRPGPDLPNQLQHRSHMSRGSIAQRCEYHVLSVALPT